MLFAGREINQYIEQKEYIDTAVVPLIELDLGAGGIRQSSAAAEYMISLTSLLERQFKGRLLLLPPVSYPKNSDRAEIGSAIRKELESSGIKHVFYMTSDVKWRSEEDLDRLLWLPAVPVEHMDPKFRQSVMEDQLRQVLPLVLEAWNASS
ncbi:DUF2487 family protein [Indiicoccus explosivorum]|uniref:DUF2487 family protein n=1 Tax=Indiicoccus explosivorum TaxID=1917864 RepID=UPI000B44C895|nr:DUF2487 family protein [Indiicoccus explosivorum]